MSPRWKTKTGAAMGKSQDGARFDLGIFSCVLCFQDLLYQNGKVKKWARSTDTCDCIGNLFEHREGSGYFGIELAQCIAASFLLTYSVHARVRSVF
jgi:hypothetical protein